MKGPILPVKYRDVLAGSVPVSLGGLITAPELPA